MAPTTSTTGFKSAESLLERMRKLAEEQNHLLDVEMRNQQEYEEELLDITESAAYKKMSAVKICKGPEGGRRIVRTQPQSKPKSKPKSNAAYTFAPLSSLGDWENDLTETRDQGTGRESVTDEQRE